MIRILTTVLLLLSTQFIIAQGCDTCEEAAEFSNGCKFTDPAPLASGLSGRLPDCPPPCAPVSDGSQPAVLCNGGAFVANNMAWYAFVASSESLDIKLEISNCEAGLGMQFGIYESCDWENCVVELLDCTTSSQEVSGSFIPGRTYYMFVDGCNGEVCDYKIFIEDLKKVTLPEIDAITAYSTCRGIYLTEQDDDPAQPSNASISGNCDVNNIITVCRGEEILFSVIHAGDPDNPIAAHVDPCEEYSEDLDANFVWSSYIEPDFVHNPYLAGGGFSKPITMPDSVGFSRVCLDLIEFEDEVKVGPVCISVNIVDDLGILYYEDKDGDGYGSGPGITSDCTVPDGYACQEGDCNDNDPNINPENQVTSINLRCSVAADTVYFNWDERPGSDYEIDLSLMAANLEVVQNPTIAQVTGFNSPCQHAVLKIVASAPDSPNCTIIESLPCRISINPPIEISHSANENTFSTCVDHSIVELRAEVFGMTNPPEGVWEPDPWWPSDGFIFGSDPSFDPNGLAPGRYTAQYTYTNPLDGCESSYSLTFTIVECTSAECDDPTDPNYPATCDTATEIKNVTTNGGNQCITYCNDFSTSAGCASNAVWFKINTDADASKMNVSFEGESDFIPLFRLVDDCQNFMTVVDCTDEHEFSSSVFGSRDYYLEVSNQGTPGEFSLCVSTEVIQASCSSVSLSPSRPEYPDSNPSGPYNPGELVEFNCEIDFTSDPIGLGNNCQWLQGIIPNIGLGWEKDSEFWTQGPAGSEFFPGDVVNINLNIQNLGLQADNLGVDQLVYGSGAPLVAGDLLPAGWWFTTMSNNCISDGTPNTMWGLPQGCGSTNTISFNFSLRVKQDVDPVACLEEDYLKLEVFALADGMTGCWISKTCGEDQPGNFAGEVDCDTQPTDNIFQDYPFLSGIVDPNNCTGTEIHVYDRGSYSFIYVETADSGILYFSDGTLYCTDSPGFSCRAAYGLDIPTTVWTCDDGGNGGGPGTPPDFIDDYPWITDHIDFSDCSGTSVAFYNFGSQIFPYIITDDSAILYSNTGQLYCTSALPTFDCIAVYGLDAPVDIWTCGDSVGPDLRLFEEYPILYMLLDPYDCDGKVTVYQSGTYIYFFVESNNVTTMYNSDGLRYCQDSPGFSCADAYGFTQNNIIDEWTCNGFAEEEIELRNVVKNVSENLVLYPNPTNGMITVSGLEMEKSYLYEIYDMQGMKLDEGEISDQQQLDITEFSSGIYLFKTLINDEIKVTRMIRM